MSEASDGQSRRRWRRRGGCLLVLLCLIGLCWPPVPVSPRQVAGVLPAGMLALSNDPLTLWDRAHATGVMDVPPPAGWQRMLVGWQLGAAGVALPGPEPVLAVQLGLPGRALAWVWMDGEGLHLPNGAAARATWRNGLLLLSAGPTPIDPPGPVQPVPPEWPGPGPALVAHWQETCLQGSWHDDQLDLVLARGLHAAPDLPDGALPPGLELTVEADPVHFTRRLATALWQRGDGPLRGSIDPFAQFGWELWAHHLVPQLDGPLRLRLEAPADTFRLGIPLPPHLHLRLRGRNGRALHQAMVAGLRPLVGLYTSPGGSRLYEPIRRRTRLVTGADEGRLELPDLLFSHLAPAWRVQGPHLLLDGFGAPRADPFGPDASAGPAAPGTLQCRLTWQTAGSPLPSLERVLLDKGSDHGWWDEQTVADFRGVCRQLRSRAAQVLSLRMVLHVDDTGPSTRGGARLRVRFSPMGPRGD